MTHTNKEAYRVITLASLQHAIISLCFPVRLWTGLHSTLGLRLLLLPFKPENPWRGDSQPSYSSTPIQGINIVRPHTISATNTAGANRRKYEIK